MAYSRHLSGPSIVTALLLTFGVSTPAHAAAISSSGEIRFTATATAASLQASTPVVTGTPKVGVTLNAAPGTWTKGTVLTYLWRADGKVITGGTKKSISVNAGHLGKKLTVTVTGRQKGYTTVSRTSKPTSAVAPGTLVTAAPTHAASARVGDTLLAKPGTWSPGTSLSYQWFSGTKAIASATKASYFVSSNYRGAKLSVKVTGKKVGYSTATRQSTSTSAVQGPTWATTKYGAFEERRVTGSGDDVVMLPTGAKAGIVIATHSGDSNFIIESTTNSGEYVGLLVNEIGTYSGTSAFGIDPWADGIPKYLEITADGPWEITFRPVSKAPTLPSTGRGDGVFQYLASAATTKTITHRGESNFIVEAYKGSDWDLVVNEIGNYSGRKRIAAGPSIIVVTADGSWSVR